MTRLARRDIALDPEQGPSREALAAIRADEAFEDLAGWHAKVRAARALRDRQESDRFVRGLLYALLFSFAFLLIAAFGVAVVRAASAASAVRHAAPQEFSHVD